MSEPSITLCLVTELLIQHFTPPTESYFTSNAEVKKKKKKRTFSVYQVKVKLGSITLTCLRRTCVIRDWFQPPILSLPVAEQIIDLLVKVFSECRRVEINVFEGAWQSPFISSSLSPPPLTPSFILKCRHIRGASCCAGCSNDAVLVKPS